MIENMLAKDLIAKYKQEKTELTHINVKIEDTTKQFLEKVASENNITFSEIVRIILEDFESKNNKDDF